MIKNKIGVGITTYNSESYFAELYNSIDKSNIDQLVVVNGGNPYDNTYECKWIQHSVNKYPATCRNECIKYLVEEANCEHIFLIEDDMLIKDSLIFNKYIEAAQTSNLKYLCFVSTSPGAGSPSKRTPRLTVEYSKDVSISFYRNMCNEFTYHHASVFSELGYYDESSFMRNGFDVDMAYRESLIGKWTTPFWWFPDITNSDHYIQNNPIAISRLQNQRSDGSRSELIAKTWDYFNKKHGLYVQQIKDSTQQNVLETIKKIKNA